MKATIILSDNQVTRQTQPANQPTGQLTLSAFYANLTALHAALWQATVDACGFAATGEIPTGAQEQINLLACRLGCVMAGLAGDAAAGAIEEGRHVI